MVLPRAMRCHAMRPITGFWQGPIVRGGPCWGGSGKHGSAFLLWGPIWFPSWGQNSPCGSRRIQMEWNGPALDPIPASQRGHTSRSVAVGAIPITAVRRACCAHLAVVHGLVVAGAHDEDRALLLQLVRVQACASNPVSARARARARATAALGRPAARRGGEAACGEPQTRAACLSSCSHRAARPAPASRAARRLLFRYTSPPARPPGGRRSRGGGGG